jgi:NADH:ubiquinone oxidoreductase subunit 3 (subunit A)
MPGASQALTIAIAIAVAIVIVVAALILRRFLGRRRRPGGTPAEPADSAAPDQVSS